LPNRIGYAPAAHKPGAPAEDRWSDKDLLLAVNGFHHFHLGTETEAAGHKKRICELVFAHVTRDQFNIIAIFNHDVFKPSSTERDRLHHVHEGYAFRGLPPGSFVLRSAITTSGHTIQTVRYAQRCARIIFEMDPKFDDEKFIEEFFVKCGRAVPTKVKCDWAFNHLDLGIREKTSKTFFTLLQGWN
jgi:hypothetical protein